MSAVLAGPPGDHCITGFKHTGTPVGKAIEVAGVPTYLSEPPTGSTTEGAPKKVVLYFADVHGPLYVNCQLLQDYFASHGYHVLGIDYFLGDPIHIHTDDPNFDRQAWIAKSRKQAAELVPKWVEAVREIYGADARYSGVGYCFGGPPVLELATTGKLVAAAFAHPASLTEDHFTNLKAPLLLSCAETDKSFPAESRRRAEDLLIEAKAQYHIQVFAGVSHGFAVRGNPDNENERWAKEESARSIIGWFNRFSNKP
ncbi:alpha/beta-hydrolase [Pluteus cervinus]|uniref:Alpha/beta-hydrolase n=1 Tax=Pluteus cervinus TaxID=181527 RepID=A0ACD3AC02_9AGAR|nr:alpha/beta-hydrolase [Pluteus cervinus]